MSVLQRSGRKVAACLPFSSLSSVALHYMQLEECRRGAAKRERVFVSAHDGGRVSVVVLVVVVVVLEAFFSVISRRGTVSCTLV